ncbi:MAG: efflux RND transporter permease subunit, partial [Bacilli bacterium]
KDFDEQIRKIDNVKHTIVKAGTSQSDIQFGNIAPANTFMIWVVPNDTKNVNAIHGEIEKIDKNAYGSALLKLTKASFMGASGTTIAIDVIGDDMKQLQKVTNTITDNLKKMKGIERVTANNEVKKTRYTYELDASKANYTEIQQQLYLLMNPLPVGTIQDGNVKRQVVVSPLANPKSREDLAKLPVNINGQIVPIDSVATLKKELTETTYYHKDGELYYHVEAFVKPEELSTRTTEINTMLFGNDDSKGIDVPDNVTIQIGGASAQQASDFSSLFIVMLVSIGIVFLIMVIQFKSIRTPVAIMVTLPLASVGSILAIMISGLPIDITSLLGALMLIGIVVTNAIVLIDRVKQNEVSMTVTESLIEASGSRIRPILMTALATIFAMTPLLFKQAEGGSLVSQNLAIIVIGGLFLSTLLTTVVIPCVYELFYFRRVRKEQQLSK